jgi:Mg2+ and Co2+ transporter CorA
MNLSYLSNAELVERLHRDIIALCMSFDKTDELRKVLIERVQADKADIIRRMVHSQATIVSPRTDIADVKNDIFNAVEYLRHAEKTISALKGETDAQADSGAQGSSTVIPETINDNAR